MPPDQLIQAIDALASGRDLSIDETADVLAVIMSGEASEAQIAAFLIALRTKGETEEELAGLVGASRERVNKAIASFLRLGWIEQNDRQYRILKRRELEIRSS